MYHNESNKQTNWRFVPECLTWEASMCWDRWKGNALGLLPTPCPGKPPFSNPLAPDTEASRCPMPIAEKAPGPMANCPGWKSRGWPVLKNCWLCRPERARLCRCPDPKCEGLSVWTTRGEKLSLLPLRIPLSTSLFDDSVESFLGLFSDLSLDKLLKLYIDSLGFLDSDKSSFLSGLGLSLGRSSHLGLNGDGDLRVGLFKTPLRSSGCSASCSLSVQTLSSMNKKIYI